MVIKSCLLLFLTTLVATSSTTDDRDGPGRFDLPVDLRGRWVYDSHDGCEGYMNVTGTTHFSGGLAFCTMVPNAQIETWIYQDCLEMTITGTQLIGKSPLHHMILNDEYLTDDWTAAGTPAQWTSKIVSPRPEEMNDAASPVVVFNNPFVNTNNQTARRYINKEGQLVQVWMTEEQVNNATIAFRLVFNKTQDMPCQGYEPTVCDNRTYTDDGVGADGWTPACCLDDYGDYQPNPNVRNCTSSTIATTTNDETTSSGLRQYSYETTILLLSMLLQLFFD